MATFICSNCSSEAPYVYQVTPSYGIPYCQRHVPRFLLAELQAGRLDKPADVVAPVVEEVVEEAPKASKKKNTPVVEDAIVEEVIEEPAPTEDPAPEVTEAE